jgi:DNA-nicking Smr family endonuclease
VAKARGGKPPVTREVVQEVVRGVVRGAAQPPDPLETDLELFAAEMRDVLRLRPDVRGRAPASLPASPAARSVPPPREPAAGGEDDQPVEAFAVPGVDRRELRRLKRGDYLAGRRSDLHGMTAVEACAAVTRFLAVSRDSGHRCVCIVHGRGLHSKGNAPVLKTRVRALLKSHPAVLAFADAPAADGGPGAVYVLLRK